MALSARSNYHSCHPISDIVETFNVRSWHNQPFLIILTMYVGIIMINIINQSRSCSILQCQSNVTFMSCVLGMISILIIQCDHGFGLTVIILFDLHHHHISSRGHYRICLINYGQSFTNFLFRIR